MTTYPSASTTGPAAGGYASPTSVTISTATTLSAANSWAIAGTGAQTGYLVVSNVTFTMGAELTVTAAKVIFQGCTFNSTVTATTSGPTMITCTGAGPYTFTYCTFCGTTSQRVNLLLNQGADAAFTVNYCNFYYMRQAIQLFTGTTAGVLIENSYFHDIVLYGSDHSEPIYVGANGGCSNITINANTIENPLSQTACVYFYPIYAFTNCTISNNLLAGGDFAIYFGNDSSTGQVVTGNVFSTMFFTTSGYYGTAYNTAPVPTWGANSNVWSGNTWYDGALAGQTVPPPELTVYEHGTFTDAGENVTIRPVITDTDSGAFTDTAYPTAHITDSDSGTGTDNTSLTAHVAGADTGTGTEATGFNVFAADTGAGTDAAVVTAHVSDTDSGAFTDTGVVTAHISDTDTATGTDQWENLSTTIHDGDTGTGTDFGFVLGLQKNDVDAGTFTDAASIHTATIMDTDTGTFTDSATTHTTITDSDSFTGTDNVPLTLGRITDTDSGTGTDSVPVSPGPTHFGTDTGTFNDQGQIVSAAVYDTDSGSFTDNVLLVSTASHGPGLVTSPVHPFVQSLAQVSVPAASTYSVSASALTTGPASTSWRVAGHAVVNVSSGWNTLVRTSTTNSAARYNILNRVSTPAELSAWVTIGRINSARPSTWETLFATTQTSANSYRNLFRLNTAINAASGWNTIGRANSGAQQTQYNYLARVTTTAGAGWNVAFGTLVTTTNSSAWNTLVRVNRVWAVAYNVAGAAHVTIAVTSSWATRVPVAGTVGSTTYNIIPLPRIFTTDSARWGTHGRTQVTSSSAWGCTGRFSTASGTQWTTRKAVIRVLASGWETTSRTMVLGSSGWAVHVLAAKSGTGTWVTYARPSASLTALWETVARTHAASAANWKALVPVTRTWPAGWNTVGRTFAARLAQWNACARKVTGISSLGWAARRLVQPTGACGWNTTARTSKTGGANWNFTTHVTTTPKNCTWNMNQRTTSNGSCAWKTVGRKTYASGTAKWSTLQSVYTWAPPADVPPFFMPEPARVRAGLTDDITDSDSGSFAESPGPNILVAWNVAGFGGQTEVQLVGMAEMKSMM